MIISLGTGLLNRFVLENPLPLTIFAGIVAFILLIMALREGRKPLALAAGIAAALGGLVFLIGTIIITPAEHAERVTRAAIDAAVSGDVSRTMGYFSEDAALAVGSPSNPGRSIAIMRGRLEFLHRRYRIESNRITRLRGTTESETAATVRVTCRTVVDGGFGPTGSEWEFRVQQRPDGEWKITRITAISIAGRTPGDQLW